MPSHRRVRPAGLLVITIGWIAAAFVFVSAARDEGAAAARDLSRGEAFTLERIGGKAAARTVEFDRWLASLWHGKRLAWTLALLSLAIGGTCLHIAGLMAEAADDDEPGRPDGPRRQPPRRTS